MATRTLDTLTHIKERIVCDGGSTNNPPTVEENGGGGRTIELEITADDLRKLLALAEANYHHRQ
ncbi:hypothetical protein GGF44_001786, partial [Coemansia sp. RSA 1694]